MWVVWVLLKRQNQLTYIVVPINVPFSVDSHWYMVHVHCTLWQCVEHRTARYTFMECLVPRG